MQWSWPKVWEAERGGWWRVPATMSLCVVAFVLGAYLVFGIMAGLSGTLQNKPEYVKQIATLIVAAPVQHGLTIAACLIGVCLVHRRRIASVKTSRG